MKVRKGRGRGTSQCLHVKVRKERELSFADWEKKSFLLASTPQCEGVGK